MYRALEHQLYVILGALLVARSATAAEDVPLYISGRLNVTRPPLALRNIGALNTA